MHCVLAVDGGNTKTVALVAALDGTILGAGRGGCGDIYNAPIVDTQWTDSASAAIANIEYAVEMALHGAHAKASELVAAVFNMAGADWPEDFTLIQIAMKERGYGRILLVQNDAMGVLHAGVADNVGVSVVCGTGGATGARGSDGRIWHSSFWQDQIQGSSHISQKALEAVIRSELGIDPPTTLKDAFLRYYGLRTVEEMLHLFTSREKHVTKRLDGLTPFVLDEAEAGDSVAKQVVLEHGRALGNYAKVAARKVGLEGIPFTLVLAGGVLRHPSTLLADTIIERVQTTSPKVRPVRCRFEPIVGVLFSALEAAGVEVNNRLIERVSTTIPATDFFTTSLV